MSKKDIIKALIEAGNPFEKVVELSECKEPYVKAQYTKLGLDWKAASIGEPDEQEVESEEPEVEAPEAEPAEEPEAELSEEVVEEGQRDPEGAPEPDAAELGLDVPDPIPEPEADIKEKSWYARYLTCAARLKAANDHPGKGLLKRRTERYRTRVGKILEEKELTPETLLSINSMYKAISPRPNAMNSHRQTHKLHKEITLLFREVFANR